MAVHWGSHLFDTDGDYHFVVIKSITADKVTYIDTGAGKDKQNDEITLSKKDFQKAWSQKILLDQSQLQTIASKPASQTTVLQNDSLQQLRGACLFLIIPIIAAISSIAAAVGAVLAGIGAIIASVGAMVGTIIAQIGAFVGTVLQGIGQALYAGIHLAASTVMNAGTQLFGTLAQQSFFGGLAHATFGQTLFQTAVRVGINYAVNAGLGALGVDPRIAGAVSAFTSGGIMNGGFLNASAFVTGGLQGLAQAIPQFMTPLLGNLDPTLKGALSILGSGFTNGAGVIDIGYGLTHIAGTMLQAGAFYGLNKLGASLGFDPRISSILGSTISGVVGGAFEEGANIGKLLIDQVNDALWRGAASFGIEYLTDKAGIDPIFAALIARTASGALEGVLDPARSLLQGVFDGFAQSFKNLLSLGGTGNAPYDLMQLQDFADTIRERGFEAALESYATSIFSRDSIESIASSGKTIKAHVEQMFAENKVRTVVLANGKQALEIPVNKDGTEYLIVSADRKQILGRRINGLYEEGTYSKTPSGAVVLTDGKQYITSEDGSFAIVEIKGGKYQKATLIGDDRNVVLSPDAAGVLDFSYVNGQFVVKQGAVEDVLTGERVVYNNGSLKSKDLLTGGLSLKYNDQLNEYTIQSYVTSYKEEYGPDGNLISVRLLNDNETQAERGNVPAGVAPEFILTPEQKQALMAATVGAGGAGMPNISMAFVPVGAGNIKWLAAVPILQSNGGAGATPKSGSINNDNGGNNTSLIGKIQNWIKGFFDPFKGKSFKPFDPNGGKVQIGVDPRSLKPKKDLENVTDPERLAHAENNLESITVNSKGEVQDGHHRLKMALSQGRAVDINIQG